jgi:outer membrane protein
LLLIKDYQNFDIEDEGYDIVDDGIADKDVYEIIEKAKENRAEIKIAEKSVELAEKDVQIAKGASLPTLSAFFGYDTRYTNANSFIEVIDPDNPFITEEIGIVEETGQSVVGRQSRNSGLQPISTGPGWPVWNTILRIGPRRESLCMRS